MAPDKPSPSQRGSNLNSKTLPGIRIRWNKTLVAGAVILGGFVLSALAVEVSSVFGFRITAYNPVQQDVGPALAPPSLAHPFGTDLVGRDVLSRVIAATPNDLFVGFTVVAISFVVGIVIGSFAGYKGGLIDEALMRFTDIFLALPALILAMAIGLVLGVGLVNMTIALTLIWWPPYARLARGEALKVSHQNFVEAARISGRGTRHIVFDHIFPNVLSTMVVYATLDIGVVILIYSGLSYLGLSVAPPTPDWGQMVAAYQDYLLSAPWLPVFPGLAIALGVVGFSILGDGLRDSMEVG